MEDGEAVGNGEGICDAGCPSAELPPALLCLNAQGEEGHQGWGSSMFDKAESPPTLMLHTRDVVIPSLLWKAPNGAFLPPERSAETWVCNLAQA